MARRSGKWAGLMRLTWLDLVRRPGLAEAQMSMLDDASAALPEPYGGDYEAARQLISFDMRN